MKNIRDYLHLYFGCEIVIENTTYWLVHEKHKHTWDKFNIQGWFIDYCNIVDPPKLTFKLLLRPLSDMTQKEAEHFAWLCMDSEHHLEEDTRISKDEVQIELAKYDGGNLLDPDIEIYIGVIVRCFEGAVVIFKDGSISVVDEEGKAREPIDNIAHKVHYLLTRGFDIFGLIESGLAIDKTNL